jgi:peptidoglycan hydrolase-like protein with peptidoglycan-binding domain
MDLGVPGRHFTKPPVDGERLQFRRIIGVVAAGLLISAVLPAATTRKKKSTKKKPAAAATRRVPAQAEPTPERYKQFQEALIAKGYLHGEANGKWDEASADAMRRFQRDQNLEPTGKPNQSLSIIALGLGPKY